MLNPELAGALLPASGVPGTSALTRGASLSTPAPLAPQGLVAQSSSADVIDIETISLDDVEIIPTHDINDLTADLIVVPPATTADALTPITSELTYALLQNTITTTIASTPVTRVTYATQGSVCYTSQYDPISTTMQVTVANVAPVSTQAPMPCQVTPSTAQPDPIASVPSPPKKLKQDDAVFLTPLPIITYTKPPTKPKPKPRPSNPNQNQLIKALLAQKSTPGPFVARPAAPRSTSFIIRASTQSPTGKTQFLNLPVNVSTPVSIVRNGTQAVPVRPTITHNLLVKDMAQRAATTGGTRSAFVRTSTGNDVAARKPVSVPVASTHATTTTAITTPMTMAPQVAYSISPIIANTSTGSVVTTTVNTAKPFIFTATPTPKPRTTSIPTYTKTYIPVPQFHATNKDGTPAKTPTHAFTLTKTHNLVGSKAPTSQKVRTANPSGITMLGPRGFVATSVAPVVHRPGYARTNTIPGYKSRHLEPGEIPQVRRMPPRTFLGPRSVSLAQRPAAEWAGQQGSVAQLKAARHAEHHAESQAQLRALQAHGGSRAVLHATSLAALQAASHAQLEAASQARLKLQHTKNKAAQSHHPPTSQTQLHITSLGQLQTVALSQPQGTLNVQLLTASQAQMLGTSKMQLITTQAPQQTAPQSQAQEASQAQPKAATQAQIIIASQPQFQATSQAQLQSPQAHLLVVSQGQLKATSQAQLEANSQVQHVNTSQAQFQAVSQAQYSTNTQAQTHSVLQAQLQAPFRTDFKQVSQPHVLTTSQAPSQAQLQAVSHVQLIATSHPQFQGVSQAQLQATSQMQTTPNASQAQLQGITHTQLNTSQAQFQGLSQAQQQPSPQAHLQTVSPAQLQTILTQSQSGTHTLVQPSARTHHRLIIRSAASNAGVERLISTPATLQGIANAAVAVTKTQSDKPATAPAQGSSEVASSSIHTTSTLTLSTGTTLIMPHYKTTVFKNLSTIPRTEPARLATPTSTAATAAAAAATAERVVIRRPVAYFSARRTFPPNAGAGSGGAVSVQRHIIRTIPRHVLGAHLQSPVLQPVLQNSSVLQPSPVQQTQASAPGLPIVSPSSSELPGFNTLSQNKSQNADN